MAPATGLVRLLRARLLTAALVCAGGASLVVASRAGAQVVTRDFSVCFTSGVLSCTSLQLTTTAFFDNGNTRIGTGIDVYVRHAEGMATSSAVRSALTGFYFSYAGANVTPVSEADVSDESGLVSPLILPEGDFSSPFPVNAGGWTQLARSSTTTSLTPSYDTYLSFANALTAYDASSGLLGTQFIGGCGVAANGGAIDAVYGTELTTCGGGSYWFTSFTSAWFDADRIHTVGVSTYALFDGAATGVAAFCDRYFDTGSSFGDADGSFTDLGPVCAEETAVAVSEPSGAVLMLAGAGAWRLGRHRRRSRYVRRGE